MTEANTELNLKSPVDPAGAPAEIAKEPDRPDPNASSFEEPKSQEKLKQDMPKWGWDRLHEESNKRQAESAARAAAEKRAKDAEELLARLQKQPDPNSPPPQRVPEPSKADFEAAVRQEASKLTMAQARNEIIRNGYSEFGKAKFDEAANILAALNCVGDDFISDAVAVGGTSTHKLLAKLAAEPERAANLSMMDSRARIAELTRMSMAEPEPKAEVHQPFTGALSKAPPPKPKIDPTQASLSDPNDLMDENISDDEFWHRYQNKYMKKSA